MPVATNSLKKGARVKLANGWFATIADNARGTTRIATVEGYETETGSIYCHDIVAALVNGQWESIAYTKDQVKLKKEVEAIFSSGW